MSLRDWSCDNDKFEPADDCRGLSRLHFPCCVCKHRDKTDRDDPCSKCGHNLNVDRANDRGETTKAKESTRED
jgi:hypothetical protein